MNDIKKKKIMLICIGILLVVGLTLIIIITNKDNNILCKYNENKEQYNRNIVVEVLFDEKLINYSYSENCDYNEGYMDMLVDKYDSTKNYLDFIEKNIKVETAITQDGYKLNYNINADLSKNKKVDYELLGIEELKKSKSKEDIIKYYTNLDYICEK